MADNTVYHHRPLVASETYDHRTGTGVEEVEMSAADYFNAFAPVRGVYSDADLGPNPDEFMGDWSKTKGEVRPHQDKFGKDGGYMSDYVSAGLKMPNLPLLGVAETDEVNKVHEIDNDAAKDVNKIIQRADQAAQKLDRAIRTSDSVPVLKPDRQHVDAREKLEEQSRLVEQMEELRRRNATASATLQERSGSAPPDNDIDQKVGGWLEDLGLAACKETFRRERIDAAVLVSLTDPELVELGVVRLGERVKLRSYARQELDITTGEARPAGATLASTDSQRLGEWWEEAGEEAAPSDSEARRSSHSRSSGNNSEHAHRAPASVEVFVERVEMEVDVWTVDMQCSHPAAHPHWHHTTASGHHGRGRGTDGASSTVGKVVWRLLGPEGGNVNDSAGGEVGGIGVKIVMDAVTGEQRVEGVKRGSVAERSGRLFVGDVVLSVDGVEVRWEERGHLRRRIQGPPLSVIRLRIRPAGGAEEEVEEVELQREAAVCHRKAH